MCPGIQTLCSQIVKTISGFKPNYANPSGTKIPGKEIQDPLLSLLERSYPEIFWAKEQSFGSQSRDRIDILGVDYDRNLKIVIEIDNARADQIAKKALSRISQITGSNLIYIAVTYSNCNGSESSLKKEAAKYKLYTDDLIKRMDGLEGHSRVFGQVSL